MTYGIASSFGRASRTIFGRVKVGGGGFISGLDIHAGNLSSTGGSVSPDGTKVCRTDTGGALLHNGTNWVPINTHTAMPSGDAVTVQGNGNGVYEIKIAPSNSSRLYMSFGGNCYTSTNKGSTWTKTTLTQEVNLDPNANSRGMKSRIAIDPMNELVVIYTSPVNGPYYSIDGGANWTAITGIAVASTAGDGSGGYLVAFDPTSTVTSGKTQGVYLSSYGTGVYRSTTGVNGTFTLTTSTPTTHFSMDISSDGYVYLLPDPPGTTPGHGTNFTTVNVFHAGAWSTVSAGSTHGNYWQGICADPNTVGRVVVVDGDGNLSISLDHGITWTGRTYHTNTTADVPWIALAQGPTGGLNGAGLVFDGSAANTLYTTGGLAVYVVNPPSTQTLTSISNASPAVFTKTAHGYSANDPIGFNVSAGGSLPTGLVNDLQYYVIATGLTANTFQVSGTYGGGAINTTSAGSGTFSATGGAKWQGFTAGIENLDGVAVFKPSGTSNVVLGVWDRTTFTTSSPSTYAATEYSATFSPTWHIDGSPTTPSTLVANTTWFPTDLSGYSLDSGTTWTAFATPRPGYGVGGCQAGGCIAISPGGGVGISTTNIVSVYTDNSTNANQVYYTTNGGSSWATATFPVAVSTTGTTGWGGNYQFDCTALCADRVTAGTFYAYNDQTKCVYRSIDSGANWSLRYDNSAGTGAWSPLAAFLRRMEAVPNNASHVVLGFGKQNATGVDSGKPPHLSKDGGGTWTQFNTGDVWAFGFGKGNGTYPAMYIAGYVGGVWGLYRSDNADQAVPTWTACGDGFPLGYFDRITRITGDPDVYGKFYVAFAGSGFAYATLG